MPHLDSVPPEPSRMWTAHARQVASWAPSFMRPQPPDAAGGCRMATLCARGTVQCFNFQFRVWGTHQLGVLANPKLIVNLSETRSGFFSFSGAAPPHLRFAMRRSQSLQTDAQAASAIWPSLSLSPLFARVRAPLACPQVQPLLQWTPRVSSTSQSSAGPPCPPRPRDPETPRFRHPRCAPCAIVAPSLNPFDRRKSRNPSVRGAGRMDCWVGLVGITHLIHWWALHTGQCRGRGGPSP
jgi:hypothetical protein